MKVLVFNGSPKKVSDTFRMTSAFLKGMRRTDYQDIKVLNVIDMDISPCRGCFGCWARDDGHCVIDDDMNGILDRYRQSDLVIWSFPLYVYSMPSHLKAVLDRTIPLSRMTMVNSDRGSVRHESLTGLSHIRNLVICGCGFPDWKGNFDALRLMCRNSFRNLDMICVPEAPMMNVPEAAVVVDPLLERFERAGEEYASSLTLSDETVAGLEAPMIPAEVYMGIVNGGG